jgi:hypothetical protein
MSKFTAAEVDAEATDYWLEWGNSTRYDMLRAFAELLAERERGEVEDNGYAESIRRHGEEWVCDGDTLYWNHKTGKWEKDKPAPLNAAPSSGGQSLSGSSANAEPAGERCLEAAPYVLSKDEQTALNRTLMQSVKIVQPLSWPEEPSEAMYRATDGRRDAYGFNHATQKPEVTYETVEGIYRAMRAAHEKEGKS